MQTSYSNKSELLVDQYESIASRASTRNFEFQDSTVNNPSCHAAAISAGVNKSEVCCFFFHVSATDSETVGTVHPNELSRRRRIHGNG